MHGDSGLLAAVARRTVHVRMYDGNVPEEIREVVFQKLLWRRWFIGVSVNWLARCFCGYLGRLSVCC